ncbi:collagen-like triple helix repeat-containing protein, partial [Kerstersia similis]|uniref:collagen-like triple helix repeat-containing protein n=1 Tax=Kerstersia similis TaxID=206505 RepID=UPI0039EE270D
GEAAPILVTALGNTGQALDNVLPLGLSPTLAGVGETLDGVVSPVLGTVTGLTQQLGGATGLGATVDGVTTQLGGVVSSLGDQLGGTLPIPGVGGLVSGLGDTVSSVGALLNPNHPDAGNPLGAVLGNATGAVASLTEGLGLGDLGLGGGEGGGLLSPVTGLVGGLLGGLGGQAGNGEAGQQNGGLLAPVTGLVGGLLGGLTGGLGGAR